MQMGSSQKIRWSSSLSDFLLEHWQERGSHEEGCDRPARHYYEHYVRKFLKSLRDEDAPVEEQNRDLGEAEYEAAEHDVNP